jgi:hypothetical protein
MTGSCGGHDMLEAGYLESLYFASEAYAAYATRWRSEGYV